MDPISNGHPLQGRKRRSEHADPVRPHRRCRNRQIVNKFFMAVTVAAMLALPCAQKTDAQSPTGRIEVGTHFISTRLQTIGTTEQGIGGRAAFYITRNLAMEGEVNFFPRDLYPTDFGGRVAFSTSMLQGLFGAKAGIHLGKFGIFGKLRPGFVRFSDADRGFPCVRIFPTPLSCILAEGKTEFAVDFGGGVEFYPLGRMILRFDAGDMMVRFGGPVWVRGGPKRDDWNSHDFQFQTGVGIRF